ncbi:MAG: DUF4926 domain-containing protein [Geitlerinemataceae cyanobacterium]
MKLLDVVATLNPIPTEQLSLVESEYASIEYLPRGQVGTIVEIYEDGSEAYYLIEFSDRQGQEYAMATLKEDEIIVLHYELQIA